MEKITLPKASVLTSPNPVTLVCTQKPDGSTNLATVSWRTYLSFNPSRSAGTVLLFLSPCFIKQGDRNKRTVPAICRTDN